MATLPDDNALPRLALVAVTNSAMRTLCRETLLDIGFTVANGLDTGTAVVAEARQRHPDLIILSEQLSDVPASEAVKWLRSNRMSATAPIIILGRAAEMPGADHRLMALPRPITRSQLQDALTHLLSSTKPSSAKLPIH
jgi:DNA-binding response OmpR family regulator